MKIVSAEEMKNLDRETSEKFGINEEILMENASIGTYMALRKHCDLEKSNILVIAGVGNNGGDALALARKLFTMNYKVSVLLVDGSDKYSNASRFNFEILSKLNINIYRYEDIVNTNHFFDEFNLLIDGIFGISLKGNVEGKYFDLISKLNSLNAYKLALDIPSGICSDTGKVCGIAFKADLTVTYGFIKYGNIFYDGFEYGGILYKCNISIPESLGENIDTEINVAQELSQRNPNSHKGSFSKILFIGGGNQYYGAPYLNSVAFLKSGGAYSRLACPNTLVKTLGTKANEVVYYPMKETSRGNISIENLKYLIDLSKEMDLIVLGGGMSLDEEPQRLSQILISKLECPILIDADALSALAEKMEILYKRQAPTILTPHMGEMSRLCKMKVEDILKNPVYIAREFAKKYRVILVLKGARTIIAYPNGKIYINISGNSVLSVAGSGDILAGIIAGQFALGLNLEKAVSNGVFLHGYCGDLVRDKIGEDGVMAEDILNNLPSTLKNFRANFKEIKDSYSIKSF